MWYHNLNFCFHLFPPISLHVYIKASRNQWKNGKTAYPVKTNRQKVSSAVIHQTNWTETSPHQLAATPKFPSTLVESTQGSKSPFSRPH